MDFKQFEQRMKRLHHDTPQFLKGIIYQLGEEFLNHIVDEINRQDLIDNGGMWQSFTQGGEGNVWEFDIDRDTLTLEVGSNLGAEDGKRGYPELVNDGYTIEKGHFVPGYFKSNGGFVYDPEAKSGFWARPRSFIGRKYFDIALKDFKGGMQALLSTLLDEELKRRGL